MLITLLFIFNSIVSAGPIDETFNCNGNLIAKKTYLKKTSKINDGDHNFRFDRKDTESISIFLPYEKQPIVKVFPWDGIHYKILANKDLKKNISVKVEGEKFFKVDFADKKDPFHLECKFFE